MRSRRSCPARAWACSSRRRCRRGRASRRCTPSWPAPGHGAVTVLPILDAPAPWWRVVAADVVNLQYAPDLYRDRVRALRATLSIPTVVTFHTLLDRSRLRSGARALWLLTSATQVVAANEEVTAMVRRRLPWV